MTSTDSIAKFCNKCQSETNCYASGQCKPCAITRAADWQAANSDRLKLVKAAYYAANVGKIKAATAAYATATLEARRIRQSNRRARKRANGGVLSRGLPAKLFALQKGKCACCKKSLGENYHLDHIMPLALGGANTDDNMQLLTATCNMSKQASHPIDFMQRRGFLL